MIPGPGARTSSAARAAAPVSRQRMAGFAGDPLDFGREAHDCRPTVTVAEGDWMRARMVALVDAAVQAHRGRDVVVLDTSGRGVFVAPAAPVPVQIQVGQPVYDGAIRAVRAALLSGDRGALRAALGTLHSIEPREAASLWA